MGNWTIRRAEQGDAEALSACLEAAYAHYAARIADLPPVAADRAEEIARFQVWVAETGNDVVGGLVLVPRDSFMLLANVAVHPDHMGAGLGRALMARAEAESLAQGYREMRLNTHIDMPENVQALRPPWMGTGRPTWQQDRNEKAAMRVYSLNSSRLRMRRWRRCAGQARA